MYLYETEKKLKEKSKQVQNRLNTQKQQYEKMTRSLKENSLYLFNFPNPIEMALFF